MKPEFALSLSFDHIRLLHRAAGGWRAVGTVEAGSDAMSGELEVLRKTAASLEPGGVRSKLLIPDAQIKYLTLDTAGMDDAARRDAARLALDGATPYAVRDLVFDISPDGARTHVAAVARDTLDEAEAFASAHRFGPVSFVAAPQDDGFLGEPFFGPTKAAASLLAKGETVEPDGVAVVEIGAVDIPEGPVAMDAAAPDPQEVPEPAPQETPPPAPEPTPEPEPVPVPQPGPDTDPAPKPDTIPPPAPETPPEPETEPGPEPEVVPPAPAPTPEEIPPATPNETPPPVPQETPPSEPEETPPSMPDEAPPLPPTEIPMPPPGGGGQPTASQAAPGSNAPQIATGFASRRGASAGPSLGGANRSDPDSAPEPKPIAPPTKPIAAAEPSERLGFLSRRKPGPTPPARGTVSKPVAAAPRAVKPATATPTAPTEEAQRMTVFGARKSQEVGGKPRYLGLILTAALLVFLAGVAAWASVFLDEGIARLFGTERATVTTQDTAPPAPQSFAEAAEMDDASETDAAASDDAEYSAEPEETASLDPGLTDEDTAVLDALRAVPDAPAPQPEAPDAALATDPMDENALQAQYAVTGIWPMAPQVPDAPAQMSLDDLYLTSIDPISPAQDAVALPDVRTQGTDDAPASISSPSPAGTQFTLRPDGLVVASAAGALSPDGYTVFAGPPPRVPPPTPTRFETSPEQAVIDSAMTSALAQLRPRTRPDELMENNERATLDGLTRSELAGLRPRLRPETAKQATEDADDAPTAAATATSRLPNSRPGNFSQIVQSATQQPAASASAASTATVASVAPRTVTPSIPSSASVAREATLKNALNLRRINLIGVYGKPSARRALVRLSNGRYQKLEVGDRIDGGRVSAIGDSELRYQKGGRNVVLTMPNG
ncbi:hypothetical protein [Sulfitobacter sabulilitoris]|uniref:Translation initiation factor 2 n=1 Tax=Sulfitobacter sabulilitoris TaxID=2562655 RepID=A0A5S3PKV1_9RHOB|nr:hypothetical protein [Sulfitobacter sabulilitoris]TMM55058.1 hypothetical protein FDT80_05675 [Sulfitobacter sabulilitoris]